MRYMLICKVIDDYEHYITKRQYKTLQEAKEELELRYVIERENSWITRHIKEDGTYDQFICEKKNDTSIEISYDDNPEKYYTKLYIKDLLGLEPFNMEKYLKNPNIEMTTRDEQYKVRIVCTDCNDEKPIIAVLKDECKESVLCYYKDGRLVLSEETKLDIMFKTTKNIGWINLFKYKCNTEVHDETIHTAGNTICFMDPDYIFDNKSEAVENIKTSKLIDAEYMGTAKIEWDAE